MRLKIKVGKGRNKFPERRERDIEFAGKEFKRIVEKKLSLPVKFFSL